MVAIRYLRQGMNKPQLPEGSVYSVKEYRVFYALYFRGLTNQELAQEFNQKVRIRYFNVAIQGFMNAMIYTLKERAIDCTEIETSDAISWACEIKIVEGKIFTLKDSK